MARKKGSGESHETLPLFANLKGWPGGGTEPERSSPARGKGRGGGDEDVVPLPDWSDLPPLPKGVAFGTSSWTYPGWKGTVYSRSYKATGDTVAMLAEYARTPLFGCVGVDSTFYRPPSRQTLQSYREVMPPGFEALGKVYDRFTIRRFTNDKRWGELAGQPNPDFLNPALCTEEVIGPWLEELGDRAGPLLFEFQAMFGADRPRPQVWAEELARFFEKLPKEGRYAVEIRNPELLHSAYFDALHSVGVAHLFNAWTRMPTIGEQLNLPGSLTAPFVVARCLLMAGRTYDEAVDKFKPYASVQEVQPQVRDDVVELIRESLKEGLKVYILVNNRLEGHSPGTIKAIRQMLADRQVGKSSTIS